MVKVLNGGKSFPASREEKTIPKGGVVKINF
jgi:hypothetical protein